MYALLHMVLNQLLLSFHEQSFNYMNLLILYQYILFQFQFNLMVFYEQLHELDEK